MKKTTVSLHLLRKGNEAFFEACSWEEYSAFVSQSMQLGQKYNVMALLNSSIGFITNPEPYKEISVLLKDRLSSRDFTEEEIMYMSSIISIQIYSLAQELTENLAAICFSYAEACRNNDVRLFPLLLRDFGRINKSKYDPTVIRIGLSSANKLYKTTLGDNSLLSEYFGTKDSVIASLKERIEQITNYRTRFDRWYNKYKHTHSTIPVTIHGEGWDWYIIHRIFESISLDSSNISSDDVIPLPVINGGKVILPQIETESFLSTQHLKDANRVGLIVLDMWKEVRKDRHKELFGEDLPI